MDDTNIPTPPENLTKKNYIAWQNYRWRKVYPAWFWSSDILEDLLDLAKQEIEVVKRVFTKGPVRDAEVAKWEDAVKHLSAWLKSRDKSPRKRT